MFDWINCAIQRNSHVLVLFCEGHCLTVTDGKGMFNTGKARICLQTHRKLVIYFSTHACFSGYGINKNEWLTMTEACGVSQEYAKR